jgi:hypothetical protein
MKADLWYAVSSPDEDVHPVQASDGNTLTPSSNGNGTFPKVTVAG